MSIAIPHPTSCRDWRVCDARAATVLVESEVRAWRETLSWDVAHAWSVIEPARLAGRLPGIIAFDDAGQPTGWTAYLPHGGHLQVMAFVARDAVTAAALVDGMLESAEARTCESVIYCVRDAAPDLAAVLRQRRFDVDVYRYLVKDLADAAPAAHALGRWQGHDEAMAALCATAYRDSSGVRAFAPDGTLPEWRRYVATLVEGTACGWFLPELSFVVPTSAAGLADRLVPTQAGRAAGSLAAAVPRRPAGPSARRLDACLMLTDLGTGAVHIAQLAVDPSARGRGLGRQLVSAAIGEASRFYEQMSLLVSGSNGPAVRLYAALGFRDHATFIVASRSTAIA